MLRGAQQHPADDRRGNDGHGGEEGRLPPRRIGEEAERSAAVVDVYQVEEARHLHRFPGPQRADQQPLGRAVDRDHAFLVQLGGADGNLDRK